MVPCSAPCNLILNENARGDIDASFTNLRATLENINSTTHNLDLLIAKESQHISGILTNVDKVMANGRQQRAPLQHLRQHG